MVPAGADAVAEGNLYGHAHLELLERAAVLRADGLGTIEVTADWEQMWWLSIPFEKRL